jgi:hypothetical protein
MFKIFDFFKQEVKPQDVGPKPDELWELFDEGDPFPGKYKPVRIREVKEGWVRYAMGSSVFSDERRTIESFTSMYRKVK